MTSGRGDAADAVARTVVVARFYFIGARVTQATAYPVRNPANLQQRPLKAPQP
jgi:hypothetical protein